MCNCHSELVMNQLIFLYFQRSKEQLSNWKKFLDQKNELTVFHAPPPPSPAKKKRVCGKNKKISVIRFKWMTSWFNWVWKKKKKIKDVHLNTNSEFKKYFLANLREAAKKQNKIDINKNQHMIDRADSQHMINCLNVCRLKEKKKLIDQSLSINRSQIILIVSFHFFFNSNTCINWTF